MVLRRKITPNMKDINEVIAKGGHVAADNEKKDKKEWPTFCLRIKASMLKQIEDALTERIGMTKTGWILEAIQEKLKKG